MEKDVRKINVLNRDEHMAQYMDINQHKQTQKSTSFYKYDNNLGKPPDIILLHTYFRIFEKYIIFVYFE